jgi:ubiquinone biosynthesis protein COQ9
MDNTVLEQKNALLAAILANVAFDGFSTHAISMAEQQLRLEKGTAFCLFPAGIPDVLEYWHDCLHTALAQAFLAQNPPPAKIREKIHSSVMLRLHLLKDVKPAVRAAMGYYTLPTRALDTSNYLYQIVDQCWRLAGDTSTDYNFYSKRLLLAGVYLSTLLYWLQDESKNQQDTADFLARRIEDVLKIPQITKAFKKPFSGIANVFAPWRVHIS